VSQTRAFGPCLGHFPVYHRLCYVELYVVTYCSSEELQEKYEGKLSKEITGPTYEVMGKVMKAIVNRKITVPGGFVG
jgi:hypothetical protein